MKNVDFERESLPFDSEYFDIVISSEVLEHIIDQDFVLREIRRVLKMGGELVLTLPNINTPVGWLMQLLLDLPPKNSARYKSPHYRDFTVKLAKRMLELNGFRVDTIMGTTIYPFKGFVLVF